MRPTFRIAGIIFISVLSSFAWLILGGVMSQRTHTWSDRLRGNVSDLWGRPQQQHAPTLTLQWTTTREDVSYETVENKRKEVRRYVTEEHTKDVSLASSRVDVGLQLDQRLKGLMWYALYDVAFDGTWTYVHTDSEARDLRISFAFPDPAGLYDGFKFAVDGVDLGAPLRPEQGQVAVVRHVAPGEKVTLSIGYRSRGQDQWSYALAQGVGNVEDFKLTMNTDFRDIDFPGETMSPSSKLPTSRGWRLDWNFQRIVTGHGIGLVMPTRLQPGDLAAELSYSAPISLAFFFLLMFVLTTLRGIELHPINYLLLAGAFFAFHLLFGYSVDHLTIVPAFVLSSVVSVVLVVTYLWLVIGPRFAFVEAALAQIVYLVGFSLAHFWEGYTGLTVTVLSILTLFMIMQLTARLRWSEVLERRLSPLTPAPAK